jgi:protein TonB
MSILQDSEGQLERELAGEPVAAPATGSIVLHAALFGGVLLWGMVSGWFHGNTWGGSAAGGAIQVNLVSSALPLPSDQPPNQNVLATDKPSQAPVLPLPKAPPAPVVDQKTIDIQGKQEKPKPKPAVKTPPVKTPTKMDNRAQYGEQAASNIPKATAGQTTTNGPVSVTTGDFGTRFGWYVEVIKRKVDQNWFRAEVDPRTPKGAKAQIYFRVNRQGVPSGFGINISSGSPTLDRSCLRATQRVDSFGPLPPASNDQWLDVTYDCTY